MAKSVDGRAVEITQGNVNNSHVPISPIKALFPKDSFGGGSKSEVGVPITITFVPGGTVETDIAADKSILRVRSSVVEKFYHAIGAKNGTRLFVEVIGPRAFRISAIT